MNAYESGAPLAPPKDAAATHHAIDVITGNAGSKRSAPVPAPALKRILVGVDGTGSSSIALGWAKQLALAAGARVWVATVQGPTDAGVFARIRTRAAVREREHRIAAEVLDKAVADLERAKVKATGILVRGFAAFELLRLAEQKSIDLIVLGSHGHSGRERLLLGSVADSVKEHAACSVLIAKAPFGPGPVLIPVDGSADSRAAALVGIRLARSLRAEPRLYHVFEPPVFYDPDDARDEFKEILEQINIPSKPADLRYLLDLGHPRKRIVAYIAQSRPRLVVMGARGQGKLRHALLGATSNRVIHESDASVLVVRRRR